MKNIKQTGPNWRFDSVVLIWSLCEEEVYTVADLAGMRYDRKKERRAYDRLRNTLASRVRYHQYFYENPDRVDPYPGWTGAHWKELLPYKDVVKVKAFQIQQKRNAALLMRDFLIHWNPFKVRAMRELEFLLTQRGIVLRMEAPSQEKVALLTTHREVIPQKTFLLKSKQDSTRFRKSLLTLSFITLGLLLLFLPHEDTKEIFPKENSVLTRVVFDPAPQIYAPVVLKQKTIRQPKSPQPLPLVGTNTAPPSSLF